MDVPLPVVSRLSRRGPVGAQKFAWIAALLGVDPEGRLAVRGVELRLVDASPRTAESHSTVGVGDVHPLLDRDVARVSWNRLVRVVCEHLVLIAPLALTVVSRRAADDGASGPPVGASGCPASGRPDVASGPPDVASESAAHLAQDSFAAHGGLAARVGRHASIGAACVETTLGRGKVELRVRA